MTLSSYKNNVTTIVFLGFRDLGQFNLLLFTLILVIYCVTICGNFLIVTLVSYSKTLHTPMYFFLSQLSLADIILTTDICPNLMKILHHVKASISLSGCIIQYYFFGVSESCECYLLMVMSYDRYLAICFPLRYASIMNHMVCFKLALAPWLLGCFIVSVMTFSISQLQFCGPNTIDLHFCDVLPLMELSCSDTSIVQMEITLFSFPLIVLPFLMIVASYTNIVRDILKISSSQRMKAFSTCSSHLTVVSIFFGTLIIMYTFPRKGQSQGISEALAMLYTVFTPIVNPLIYSLRNKDIRNALNILLFNCLGG